MDLGREKLKTLAKLLERAAKKENESAEATCAVAICLSRPDLQLEDGAFNVIFEKVTELAGASLDSKPDYMRAARELSGRQVFSQGRKRGQR